MQDRMVVLEKIVTDRGYSLHDEIEALRKKCDKMENIARKQKTKIEELKGELQSAESSRAEDQKRATDELEAANEELAGLHKELEEALSNRHSISGPYVIVIDTDPYPSTPYGGTWWDVAVPEVSERTEVNEKFDAYVQSKLNS